MNAVEIEEAISKLAEQPFDAGEFPFAFLQAFGNKETTIKRLRKGESNKSDLGGVLQTNNIHIAVAAPGVVTNTLAALKASPATTRAKAKFVLATDGDTFEAENLISGDTVPPWRRFYWSPITRCFTSATAPSSTKNIGFSRMTSGGHSNVRARPHSRLSKPDATGAASRGQRGTAHRCCGAEPC
jgi:hypothetical protein